MQVRMIEELSGRQAGGKLKAADVKAFRAGRHGRPQQAHAPALKKGSSRKDDGNAAPFVREKSRQMRASFQRVATIKNMLAISEETR